MDDVELVAGEGDLYRVFDLSAAAFLAARQAVEAQRLVRLCRHLPELVAELESPADVSRLVADVRRSVRALARCTDTCVTHAREAGLALGPVVQVFARPVPRAIRAPQARRVQDATAQSQRALAEARRHATVAGRVGAGLAALLEPRPGTDALWDVSRRLLSALPATEEAVVGGHDVSEVGWVELAGLVAHAGWRRIAAVSVAADDGADRWARVVFDKATHVECVSDTFLRPDEQLGDEQRARLEELGLREPDEEHLHWWQTTPERPVAELVSQLQALAGLVHGLRPGDAVVVSIGEPEGHPDLLDPEDDPAVLDIERRTVPLAAAALADRLRLGIEAVGIDALWLSVHQDICGWYAHITSDSNGALVIDVAGEPEVDTCLSDAQKEQLRVLGWSDPAPGQPEDRPCRDDFTRTWPPPLDVDLACWHLMVTIAAVYGLDPDEPIRASVSFLD